MDDKTLTAAEAGYHVSDFLISAKVPDEKLFAVISLFKGSCAALRFSGTCKSLFFSVIIFFS